MSTTTRIMLETITAIPTEMDLTISAAESETVIAADPKTGDFKPFVVIKRIKDFALLTDFRQAFIAYLSECFTPGGIF